MKILSAHQLVMLFQGLHHLLSAGLDLVTALEHQSRQLPSHAKSFHHIATALRQGKTFVQALNECFVLPRIITMYLYQSQIHGDLTMACQLSLDWLRDQQAWKRMLWHLSFYPVLLILTSVALLTVMLYFVLPEFAALYQTLDVDLPASTAGLLRFAEYAPEWGKFILCLVLALSCGSCIAWKTHSGRFLIEKWTSDLPFFRRVIRLHHEYQLSLQLGTLLNHGCSLLQALEVMRLGSNSVLFRSYLSQSHRAVAQGKNLTHSLCHGLMQHQPFLGYIAHAQQTGRLDTMLLNLAKQHKETSSHWQEQAKHFIQPCITLLMGGFLGIWILLLYYPMLQLGTNLG